MKINDAIIGAVLLLLSLAVVWHVQSFPKIPGQQFGADGFPRLVGIGLGICALILILRGIRARAGGGGWAEWQSWTASPRDWLNVLAVPACLLFYILAATSLGFLIAGTIILTVLFMLFGVGRTRSLPLAIILTFLIHYAFYKLLRVPLPWGVLEPLARYW